MKKFIQTLKNIWSIEELRNKILFTLLLIFVYRVGSYIVLPGIDPNKLANLTASAQTGMLGLLDAFVGGAFSKASILVPKNCELKYPLKNQYAFIKKFSGNLSRGAEHAEYPTS